MPLYIKRFVKKQGGQEIGYIIPISYSGTLRYYNCKMFRINAVRGCQDGIEGGAIIEILKHRQ